MATVDGRAQQKEPPPPEDAPAAPLAAVVQQNMWPDEQFEQWIFQTDGGPAQARKRFDALLTLQVEETDRVCRLTEAQKAKLQLIGRGDIKRFFEGYERVKRRFKILNNDVQRLQDIMGDVGPLQSSIQAGLFSGNSLFAKSLRNTLTAEQLARYEAVAEERRAFAHRAEIELALDMLEQAMPLRDAQRRALVALLTKEIKPARTMSQYHIYLILYHVARLPAEKLQPLLTDIQWTVLKRQLEQYKAIVPNLRQEGIVLDEEDAPADAAPKK